MRPGDLAGAIRRQLGISEREELPERLRWGRPRAFSRKLDPLAVGEARASRSEALRRRLDPAYRRRREREEADR